VQVVSLRQHPCASRYFNSGVNHLPSPPDVIAQEIVDDLEAALK